MNSRHNNDVPVTWKRLKAERDILTASSRTNLEYHDAMIDPPGKPAVATEPRLTLVTGFWPQKHELVRTMQVYTRLFEELVAHVDNALPIVCCIDPRFEADVQAVKQRHSDARLEIRLMSFEELHFARGRERFADLQPANSSFNLRDTIEYAIIVWSKAATVRRIADENPFGTSHFAWIDYGIAHVSQLLDADWEEIEAMATSTDRLRVAERMGTAKSEIEDPWYFYSTNSARVCGGLFTGTRERFTELSALFDDEIARMVPTGTYALEEQVLAAVTALRPDMIERWYTDYQGVLTNAAMARCDIGTIIANLDHCRQSDLHEVGADVARFLLRSGEAYAHLLPEQCLHLLDDGMYCALRADPELANALAKTALSLYHYSRVGRGMMKGTWRKSIQASLKELGADFPDRPWTWEEFASRADFRVWLSCF